MTYQINPAAAIAAQDKAQQMGGGLSGGNSYYSYGDKARALEVALRGGFCTSAETLVDAAKTIEAYLKSGQVG